MVPEPLRTGLPIIIAGPCSIESERIALETGAFLSRLALEFSGRASFIYKSSFRKDNRTGSASWEGPGIDQGLRILEDVRLAFGLPVLTDIHTPDQAAPAAQACDMLQIPAFLCRQSSLLEAAGSTGVPVNVKKGQFMAPMNMKGAVEKLRHAGCPSVFLTERGTFFGYGDLVVDMRSLSIMGSLADGVIMDVTHSLQKPGAGMNCSGGDRRHAVKMCRAAAAWGIDGLFIEFHPDPDSALSDSAVMLDFETFGTAVHAALDHWEGT